MPTTSPRRAQMTAALLAAGLLAGCGGSSTSSGATATATTDDAITFTAGAVESVPFVPSDGEAPGGDGQPLPGRLVTPHTAQQLTAVQVTDQLSEADALSARARFGADYPTAAPEGHELVVVTLSTEDLLPPYVPGETPAATSVVVDDTPTPVEPFGTWSEATDAWTTPLRTYVVVAPVDAPVLLQVTDEDRTATLDLRTGARADDEGTHGGDAWYRAVRAAMSGSSSATGQLSVDDGSLQSLDMTVTVSLDGRAFLLSAWHPTLGWADPGRAWGTARATVDRNTVQFSGFTTEPGRVFTLSGPDGAALAPVPQQISVDTTDGLAGDVTVGATWDLPADLADGSTLQVQLDADWNTLGRPASWAASVPTLQLVTLAFT